MRSQSTNRLRKCGNVECRQMFSPLAKPRHVFCRQLLTENTSRCFPFFLESYKHSASISFLNFTFFYLLTSGLFLWNSPPKMVTSPFAPLERKSNSRLHKAANITHIVVPQVCFEQLPVEILGWGNRWVEENPERRTACLEVSRQRNPAASCLPQVMPLLVATPLDGQHDNGGALVASVKSESRSGVDQNPLVVQIQPANCVLILQGIHL